MLCDKYGTDLACQGVDKSVAEDMQDSVRKIFFIMVVAIIAKSLPSKIVGISNG